MPVNLALDVDNVEEHFDARQLSRQGQRREIQKVLDVQIGAGLVAHVEGGELFVNDEHVENSVAVDVLIIGIGVLRQHQPIALLLTQARGEAQRILAPVNVALVVGDRIDAHRLLLDDVVSRSLLIFRRHKSATTALVDFRAGVEEKLHHRRVLVDDGNVQNILAIIFVAHVNVIDELRIEAEKALRQVGVQRRCIQQAQMENRFANSAALLVVFYVYGKGNEKINELFKINFSLNNVKKNVSEQRNVGQKR